MAVINLVAGCNKTDEFTVDENAQLKSAQLKSAQSHKVTVPFEANFIGEYKSFTENPEAECGEPYFCRVIVDFEGTATHLGKIYGTFEFCACGPDDPDVEGPDQAYEGGVNTFTAANGDKLYILSMGSTVVEGRRPDHPEYVCCWWQDTWEITGGTGRFEGATGSGITDDYNSSEDPNSHHQWTGTITLVKGKR